MSNFDTILGRPVIITNKENIIKDFNFFARNIFLNLEVNKSIYEIGDISNLVYLPLNNSNIYTVLDSNITDGFFKNILDNSFDEIFVANSLGIALYCNESFEKHYGIKRCDLIGKHVNYVIENKCVDILRFDEVVENKKSITYKQRTSTGRTILNTSCPILDEKNNVMYVIENCRDITENEILYNSLIHTKSQLEREMKVNNNSSFKNNFLDFKSSSMKEIINKANRFSNNDVNILITGNSGTGKTSLAKYIHENSYRNKSKLVVVNCATIPENLIESELFGYKKGAFTGALNSGKKGLVDLAENGTLFLDEIAEVPLSIQSKLLELIQEKTFLPIGELNKKKANVRIIAATNSNLEELINNKQFREDLYYRLNVVRIRMPDLKERKEDIEILTNHFIQYFNDKYNLNVSISKIAFKYLYHYSFPGNIRELEYLIEYLILNTQKGEIKVGDLPKNITTEFDNNKHYVLDKENSSYKELMLNAEKNIILECYNKLHSSYKVAKALGISQTTANRLINKHCK